MDNPKHADTSPVIIDTQGNPVEIPPEGSLALLALGAVGVQAWRARRHELGLPDYQYVDIIKVDKKKGGPDE